MLAALRKSRHRTVLYKYFSVILAICAAILIVSTLASYRILERVVVEQVHAKSVEQLEQVRSVFDAVHFSVIPATVQLSEDRLVTALMYSGDPSQAQVLQAMGRLDTAKLSNPLVDSIIVYNHLNATFYTTEEGMVARKEYADAELVAMLDNARAYGLYRYIPRQIEGRGVFTLLLGTPPTVGTSLKGAMVINIGERALRDLFASSAGELADELVIYDREGIVLSHPDPGRFADDDSHRSHVVPLLSTESEHGTFVETVDGEHSLVTYVRNVDFGWSFVTVTPYRSIFRDVIRTRNTVLVVLAGLLVFAVLAAFVASRRLYQPIGSMRSFARRLEDELLAPDGHGSMENELEYVDAVLHRVYLKTQSLSTSIVHHRTNSRREATRTAILSGSVDALRELGEAGADASSERPCRVIVALLDESAAVHRRHDYQDVMTALTRYASDLSERVGSAYPGVEIEPDHVAVLVIGDDSEALDADRLKLILAETTTWDAPFGTVSFSVGIGTETESLEDAPFSYRSARAAAQLRFSHGPGCVVSAAELDGRESEPYRFPDATADRLVQTVRVADSAQAHALLNEILDEVEPFGYDDFLLLAHLLLHRLHRCAPEARPGCDGHIAALGEIRARLGHLETIEEARACFQTAVRELCAAYAHGCGRKQRELAHGVRDAIDADLTDPNLSSKWLADRFSVSTNYLRSVFRDVHGVSVSDYINEARIELCKRRLEDADVRVKELYAELGFGSYNYFFTLFRKHTGMTPLQYRRSVSVRSLS